MGARACAHRKIYKVKYKVFYGRARIGGADLHARQKKNNGIYQKYCKFAGNFTENFTGILPFSFFVVFLQCKISSKFLVKFPVNFVNWPKNSFKFYLVAGKKSETF